MIHNTSAKLVAEYSTIVEPQATAKASYLTQDHLGSPRVLTDQNGAVISRRDFLPFGEETPTGTGGRTSGQGYVGADSIRQKFTGYERDSETALDFAQARMFGSGIGRFTSPDPALVSARVINPQTLNRYIYVLNNPLLYVDPFGLWELQYEPEYEKNKDGTFNTRKVKRIKIFFVKTKDDDNADSLLKQLGFSQKDKGYAEMKRQIETALSNMSTSEFGTTGILASSLKGKVDGVDIGRAFRTIEGLLGEQSNYDADNPGNWSINDSRGPSALGHLYGDCTETTARISFNVPFTDDLSTLGTQDGPSGMDERFLSGTDSIQSGNLRLLDVVRYDGNGNFRRRHYMTIVFTGDDGTNLAFSRSGEGGRFEVIRINDPSLSGYGRIGGRRGNQSGFYRP